MADWVDSLGGEEKKQPILTKTRIYLNKKDKASARVRENPIFWLFSPSVTGSIVVESIVVEFIVVEGSIVEGLTVVGKSSAFSIE